MRIIDLTVPVRYTDTCLNELSTIQPLAVRLQRGASLVPSGDVITLEVRNNQLGQVMRIADRYGLGKTGGVSMSTTVPLSVVAASHRAVAREMGVTTWEELDLSIGEDSTMILDRTIVMFIAGVIAGIGILTGALHVVSCTSSSVRWSLLPGFSRLPALCWASSVAQERGVAVL